MKIALITDAWHPQINGVVRTLDKTVNYLRSAGCDVEVFHPDLFSSIPCPGYKSIPLAIKPYRKMERMLDDFEPDAIHIATEGPVGLAGRKYCRVKDLRFTSAYHTHFPHYVRMRAPIPEEWSFAFLRWFHRPASNTLVATDSLQAELEERGFMHLKRWSRGVDTKLFSPREKGFIKDEGPISLYLGRVAVEKNIRDFLDLDIRGTKYVVGDGPQLEQLRAEYPDVRFVGFKHDEELAQHVAAADVFVFPSRTDTFGLVLLEALACGTPVAAYPVTGPIDILTPEVGVMDEDLAVAVEKVLKLDREACRKFALEYSWERASQQFLDNLVRARPGAEEIPNEIIADKELFSRSGD